ncbi:MAG TPA: hypothetical protein VKE25_03000, partial [Actinomycetes bacterium]|nr:hypothetical protein [Actinomycetes bacterium]
MLSGRCRPADWLHRRTLARGLSRPGRLASWLSRCGWRVSWLSRCGWRVSWLSRCGLSGRLSRRPAGSLGRWRLVGSLSRCGRPAQLPLMAGRGDLLILLKIDDLAGRRGQRLAIPAHPPMTIGGGGDESVAHRALLDQVGSDAVEMGRHLCWGQPGEP